MADLHDDHRNRESERDAPPVIVACAVTEQATAEEAAVALRARGHEVEVVGGVEDDGELLAATIRRHDRQGLYVLCRSPSLPRQRIDKLRSVLRGHDVPFGRTLTLAIEPGQARALEERIVSVARRMITGRPESVRPPARPLPRPVAARMHEAGSGHEDEELDTRVDEAGRAGSGPVAAEEISRWADSLAGPLPNPDDDQELETAPPAADLSDGDSMEVTQRNPSADDPLLHAVDPPDYSGVEHTEVVRSSTGLLQTVPAPVIPVEPNSAPGISTFGSAHAQRDPDPDPEGDGDSSTGYFRGRRGMGLVLGAAALVVIAVVSVAKLSASPTTSSSDETIAQRDPTADASPGPVEAGEDPDPGDDAVQRDRAEVEPSAPDDELATPDEAAPEESAASADMLVVEADARVPVLEDSPQVVEALRSRDVRAIDTLLVASEVGKDGTFADAVAYCTALEVAGLKGWRVPSIGELWTVGDAKIVKPAVYWSDTVGDAHGDKRLVLNTKRSRIVPVDASWAGSRAVCIRERS